MDKKQFLIPDRIKVGFRDRDDCYTKRIGFVVYFDKKGVLRKETSWEGWREKKHKPVEFDNKPTSGFVLNKGVGGVRQSYGWNARQEYVRVYDPRDFEFEITVPNLLFILKECNCNKGKGLEGDFVYSWNGTSLVLLPVCSEEYKISQDFTTLQGLATIKPKELILGATYLTKKQVSLIYLGKFDYFDIVHPDDDPYGKDTTPQKKGFEKRLIFWDTESKQFVPTKDTKSIAVISIAEPSPDFAELVDKFNKSPHGSRPVELFLEKETFQKEKYNAEDVSWAVEGAENRRAITKISKEIMRKSPVFSLYSKRWKQVYRDAEYVLQDGILYCIGRYGSYGDQKMHSPDKKDRKQLAVKLESGSIFCLHDDKFKERFPNGKSDGQENSGTDE